MYVNVSGSVFDVDEKLMKLYMVNVGIYYYTHVYGLIHVCALT